MNCFLRRRRFQMPLPVSSVTVPEIPTISVLNDVVSASTESERDRLVLKHLPLVRAIAVRVYENLPVHVDLDDLIHAGIMGLFDAASKYNPDKKVIFHSYAKHRIKGAILD